MCLRLYLATAGDQPLQSSPDLRVDEVDEITEPVRQWFSLPTVRSIGAHTGCGCGFANISAEEPTPYFEGMFDGLPEREADLRSMAALVTLVQQHVEASGAVQLYPVWNGEEHLAPKGTIELEIGTLEPPTFFLNERFLYRITAA